MKTKKWTNHFLDIKNEYVKSYIIPAGGTIDTGIGGIKLIHFTSISLTGTGVLVLASSNGDLQRIAYGSAVFSINDEASSHLSIYMDLSTYTIKIKNNNNLSITVDVEVLNL